MIATDASVFGKCADSRDSHLSLSSCLFSSKRYVGTSPNIDSLKMEYLMVEPAVLVSSARPRVGSPTSDDGMLIDRGFSVCSREDRTCKRYQPTISLLSHRHCFLSVECGKFENVEHECLFSL